MIELHDVNLSKVRQFKTLPNIPRYVDTLEEEAEIDIEAVQQEIDTLEGELAEVRGKMTNLIKEVAA